jgi:hypothetical protein
MPNGTDIKIHNSDLQKSTVVLGVKGLEGPRNVIKAVSSLETTAQPGGIIEA